MLTRPIKWLNRRQKIAATAPSAEALSALGGTHAAFTATDSTRLRSSRPPPYLTSQPHPIPLVTSGTGLVSPGPG
jgi:hypothetical protein